MAIEHDILPLLEWLFPRPGQGAGAILQFLGGALVVVLVGLLAAFMLGALRHGPGEAFYRIVKVLADAFGRDLPNFSLRRTWAVARLSIQEAIRRRVIVAFAVFVVLMLFAGWFLENEVDHPARLYVSFVLNATNFLSLLLALFLSTFSLPSDIKNKTIYTVVTKPVRAGEIVLGRVVGFALVGSALLLVTGAVSYGFVVRGLAHRHEIDPAEMTPTDPNNPNNPKSLAATGRTSRDASHRHEVTIGADGLGQTDYQMGHRHSVEAIREGDKVRYLVGPHEDMLIARVPHYGKLSFLGRDGEPSRQGISVGQEWNYRGYLEGQTQAAAIWTFDGITADRYPEGLPLEMDIRIFRTHKGNIERGVLGELQVVNLDEKSPIGRSEAITFTAVEFRLGKLFLPRKLKGIDRSRNNQVRDVDLFDDLASQGRIQIHLRCKERAQYFGAAQADLYVKANDRTFWQNLAKGYVGIWLQMLMVTAMGVMFSTFLSAPVALLGTIGTITIGYFGEFVAEVARGAEGEAEGGGPIESLIRIGTQNNLSNSLDLGAVPEAVIHGLDWFILAIMQRAAGIAPNFARFDTTRYVAYGYDIDANLLSQHTLIALAFAFAASIVGYFMLKTREIAA